VTFIPLWIPSSLEESCSTASTSLEDSINVLVPIPVSFPEKPLLTRSTSECPLLIALLPPRSPSSMKDLGFFELNVTLLWVRDWPYPLCSGYELFVDPKIDNFRRGKHQPIRVRQEGRQPQMIPTEVSIVVNIATVAESPNRNELSVLESNT
jgi:hypothetical protein